MWRGPLLMPQLASWLVLPKGQRSKMGKGGNAARAQLRYGDSSSLQVHAPNVAHVLQKPVHILQVHGAWCTECHLPKLGASARQSTDETLRRQRPSPQKHLKTRDGRLIRHGILRG